MHLVAAFAAEPRMRSFLCLFEGVATGAADGYARMTGKPAVALLHLGPGLANGMANLHNARKAATPLVVVVGDHAGYHKAFDAPLTADIETMARPVSDWVATADSAAAIPALSQAMLGAMAGGRASVATLALTNDAAWNPAEPAADPLRATLPTPTLPTPALPAPQMPDAKALAQAAAALCGAAGPGAALGAGDGAESPRALILGAPFITARMARLATAIGQASGCRILTEAAVARMARGRSVPALTRIPFHVDAATQALAALQAVVLCGARDPVAFFAYPGRPSRLLPEGAAVHALAAPGADCEAVLEALAKHIGCLPKTETEAEAAAKAKPPRPAQPPAPGPITPATLAEALAEALPAGTIVVDESITNGGAMFTRCAQAPAHDWINNRGGSIGYSMPVAMGAAVACPDRPVLCVTGDGSAFYTLQALWSLARYRLNVTVVVLANRRYAILANESAKIGAGQPGARAMALMALEDPSPDWCKIAEGHGLPAQRIDCAAALHQALHGGLRSPGPRLIEAVL